MKAGAAAEGAAEGQCRRGAADCPAVKNVIVVKATGDKVPMQPGRDHDMRAVLGLRRPTARRRR